MKTEEDVRRFLASRPNASDQELETFVMSGQQARVAPSPAPKVGMLGGVARSALQGMTFGFGDELAGLTSAGIEGIMPGGPSMKEAYAASRDDERARLGQFKKDHGKIAFASEMAGGLATGMTRALGKTALKGGKAVAQAALGGGLYGAGAAEGDVLDRVVGGALPGAALGGLAGAAIAPLANKLGRLAVSGANRADEVIVENIGRAGKTIGDLRSDVRLGSGKPFQLRDIGGKNLQDVSKVVAQVPGKGKEVLGRASAARAAQQEERMMADLMQRSGGKRENIYRSLDDIADEMETAAEKNYGAIRDVVVDDTRIADLFNHPTFQKAYARAQGILRNKNASRSLRGEAIVSDLPAIEELAKKPLTLGVLDQVKRGLDDMIDVGARPGEGGLGGAEMGSLRELKNAFIGVLDDRVPDYANARSAFAGKAAMADAMSEGRKLFSMPTDKAQYLYGKLGASEKEAFRKGALEALADKIGSVSDNADLTKRIAANPNDRARLAILFGEDKAGQQAAAGFRGDIANEATMAASDRMAGSGSDTMSKAAIMAELTDSSLDPLLDAASTGKVGLLKKGLSKLNDRKLAKISEQLAPLLASGENGVQELLDSLARLDAVPEILRLRNSVSATPKRVLGSLSGRVAAGAFQRPDRE